MICNIPAKLVYAGHYDVMAVLPDTVIKEFNNNITHLIIFMEERMRKIVDEARSRY